MGFGLAFFFVFAPLFTDGPRSFFAAERLASFALSFAVYLVAGALLGLFSAPRGVLALVLAGPGLVIAVLYAARETNIAGLAVAYVVLAGVGAFLGVRLAGLRKQRS